MRPYWTALRSCSRKKNGDIQCYVPGREMLPRSRCAPSPRVRGEGRGEGLISTERLSGESPSPVALRAPTSPRERGEVKEANAPPSSHLAAGRRIGKGCRRDADIGVLAVADLAQINVLHRVLRGGERHRPARAVEFGAAHGGVERLRRREVALDCFETDPEHGRGVITLHRIHIRFGAVVLL